VFTVRLNPCTDANVLYKDFTGIQNGNTVLRLNIVVGRKLCSVEGRQVVILICPLFVSLAGIMGRTIRIVSNTQNNLCWKRGNISTCD
jgi:hypothetical protein